MSAVPEKVRKICEELTLSDETLRRVMDALEHEINLGLNKETNEKSDVKCFPTYVRSLPNGKEKGKFLALDLGGTNFRVLLIELEGNPNHNKMVSKIYAVPNNIMVGPGTGLFDHIAQCLATFMHEHHLKDVKIPLGFTFSFPCRQEGLTKGILVTWTKGFKCAGVEGQDVVKMLQEAIQRRNDVEIDVLAVLNDTTGTHKLIFKAVRHNNHALHDISGTLMSCAYKNPDCRIGLIMGTGTNACYVEKLSNVGLWNEDYNEPSQVIINTEWGAFGSNGCLDFIYTAYDKEVDGSSINKGKQIFEKMISGMYMGDIAGLVLRRLAKEGLVFSGNGAVEIFKLGAFHTKYISEIEGDKVGDWTNCRQILLEELGVPEPLTVEDCIIVRHVCEVVSKRAAQLVSAGVACLLNKMGEKKATVAVDGSVYRYHPCFHNLMTANIQNLIRPELKFDLMLSEDGSGRGAALVAAVASNTTKKSSN